MNCFIGGVWETEAIHVFLLFIWMMFVQVPSKGASSPSDARSCVSSIGDASGSVKDVDVDHEYLSTDQGAPYPAGGYYGYYYPG